jgi:hypothetical protein
MTARLEPGMLVPTSVRTLFAEVDQEVPSLLISSAFMQKFRDTTVHAQLQHDLVEHLWSLKGQTSRIDLAQLLFV